eukprot:gene20344-20256_t
MPLADRLAPCGPVIDVKHAERTREIVESELGAGVLDSVWPALAPVLGASPYLSGLIRRRPTSLIETLQGDPEERLEALLVAAREQAAEPDNAVAARRLREQKADLHLLCALSDLGGVWDLDQVTGALSRFADA